MYIDPAGTVRYGILGTQVNESYGIAYSGSVTSPAYAAGAAIATAGTATSFCNPLLYANHSVLCPFRLANTIQPGFIGSDGSLPGLKASNFASNWGYGMHPDKKGNSLAAGASVAANATAGTAAVPAAAIPLGPIVSNCVNFIKYDNLGLPHVNQETGAPKIIDWPQLNAASQAYYWQLVQYSVPPQCDWIWRIVLLFGFFPASCTMYIRATFPETPRFTLHVEGDKAKLAKARPAPLLRLRR